MTDDATANDDGIDWGNQEAATADAVATWAPDDASPAKAIVRYPENGPLQEAPISINFKVTGEPQITVRGFTAADVTAALQDLEDCGTWANIAAAQASLRAQGQIGAMLGPVTPVAQQGPPQGPPQAPYQPDPYQSQGAPPFGANVSAPSAPGYVGPPAGPTSFPGQPSYPSAPQGYGQPQQGWGGNSGGGQGNRAEPKPQPPGWLRVNARSGPGFDAWKALREQQKENLRGKVQWGGKSDYWIEPSLGQWVAGQGFAVTQ